MRFLAVLDGTMGAGSTRRQAQALAAFLRAGLAGDLTNPAVDVDHPGSGLERTCAGATAGFPAGQTLICYSHDADKRRLVELAPTSAVRLVKATAGWPEVMARHLEAVAREEQLGLFLFAGGPAGTELATRLAWRAGGSVLTGALDIEVDRERLLARRTVSSGHLVGRFELTERPWCVAIDASWNGEPAEIPAEHDVLSDTDATRSADSRGASGAAGAAGEAGDAVTPPLEDVELVALSATSDLAASRFLVAVGKGAGSAERVVRIAAAARRMGASFGVSRPVAMNAWAPMDRLIGVSGTRAAPELVLVLGASGAPAFLWGVEKAGFIVAVNPDGHAPIARAADAVVLDDAVEVIEALAEIVEEHAVEAQSGEAELGRHE